MPSLSLSPWDWHPTIPRETAVSLSFLQGRLGAQLSGPCGHAPVSDPPLFSSRVSPPSCLKLMPRQHRMFMLSHQLEAWRSWGWGRASWVSLAGAALSFVNKHEHAVLSHHGRLCSLERDGRVGGRGRGSHCPLLDGRRWEFAIQDGKCWRLQADWLEEGSSWRRASLG